MKRKLILCIGILAITGMSACGTAAKQTRISLSEEVEDDNHEEETADDSWKQAYIPIVKQWDIDHSNDSNYGYDLIYLDGDEVPELVLKCDDDAWYAYDIYTCVEGDAVKVMLAESYSTESGFTSNGCQGKGDSFIEKTGLYMTNSGMMGSEWTCGYKLEAGKLEDAFVYGYFDSSWDESLENPYGYQFQYNDANGEPVFKQVDTDGSTDYYDIATNPEVSVLEDVLGVSFSETKIISATMAYSEMCDMLGIESEN